MNDNYTKELHSKKDSDTNGIELREYSDDEKRMLEEWLKHNKVKVLDRDNEKDR